MSAPAGAGRAVGAWIVLLGAAVVLDGLVGGLAVVVIGAVALARLPWRVLGALGVAALVAVPVVVLGLGLPSIDEVAPTFVSRSLLPHHLAFAGLLWAGTWAVIDLLPHITAVAATPQPGVPDVAEPSRGRRLAGLAAVALVAVAAVVASLAVLRA